MYLEGSRLGRLGRLGRQAAGEIACRHFAVAPGITQNNTNRLSYMCRPDTCCTSSGCLFSPLQDQVIAELRQQVHDLQLAAAQGRQSAAQDPAHSTLTL